MTVGGQHGPHRQLDSVTVPGLPVSESSPSARPSHGDSLGIIGTQADSAIIAVTASSDSVSASEPSHRLMTVSTYFLLTVTAASVTVTVTLQGTP